MFTKASDRLESLPALHGQIGSPHFELSKAPSARQLNGRLTGSERLLNHITDRLPNDVNVLPTFELKMFIFRKIQPLQNCQVRLKDESSGGRISVVSRIGSEMNYVNHPKRD